MIHFIMEFTGKYRFLSNFWIEPDGSCVEVEYQKAKCANSADVARFMLCKTPGQAKRLGKTVALRADWNAVKDEIMLNLLKHKFADPSMRSLLLSTGDAILIEGNQWHDTYWGCCSCDRCGIGENKLGHMLMEIRKNLLTNSLSCDTL